MHQSNRARLIATLTMVAVLSPFIGRTAIAADDHGHAPATHAPAVPAVAVDAAHAHPASDDHAAPATAHHSSTVTVSPVAPAAHSEHRSIPADEALGMLAAGNARFASGTPSRPNQSAARLCETFVGGQHPYAAVLSCADSRVPVELVFDAGIGDLFVVRVAGNVADEDETGTLEYGVEHLGITAVVVIGHSKCGAVTAVVDGAHVTPSIAKLVDNIVPAAEEARRATPVLTGGPLVARAIRANVRRATVELTERSPLLAEYVKSGKLKIIGGVYDIHTGQVDWLDAPPVPTAIAPANGAMSDVKPMAAPAYPSVKPTAHPAPQPHAAQAKSHPVSHAAPQAHNAAHATAVDPHAPTAAGDGAVTAGSKDNLWILGACLATGGAVSYGLIYLLHGRRAPATA
ncbi:MAG TPA: carbonic anhydrase [Tepidisphaeraceae bacterium]|jgi:carbonic anhydrase|nr:carbonic anhydrase [Tepidisphaeraceae bacterium]